VFISKWSEFYNQLMSGDSRNTPIYNAMAEEIKKELPSARSITGNDVKTKITNLLSEYRRKKREQGKSGGSPCSWRFFDQIDNIIGQSFLR
jgi:hypothetical protein